MRPGTLKGGVVRSKLWPEDYVKISLFSTLPYSKDQVWRVERMSRCRRFAGCKMVGGCICRWLPVADLSRVIAGYYRGIYVGDAVQFHQTRMPLFAESPTAALEPRATATDAAGCVPGALVGRS